ncbi:hypothetical protein TNCV_2151921 [Trichonephila clavipes]|uniref:Uncharacterized protein n=1 Tax=Trichonephila clavipes TaxID=2585209 RepID=A0A8X6R6R3_TRICX|nr:hypothetical protein TNCV_2151921 [Trichonephila clavipes]
MKAFPIPLPNTGANNCQNPLSLNISPGAQMEGQDYGRVALSNGMSPLIKNQPRIAPTVNNLAFSLFLYRLEGMPCLSQKGTSVQKEDEIFKVTVKGIPNQAENSPDLKY